MEPAGIANGQQPVVARETPGARTATGARRLNAAFARQCASVIVAASALLMQAPLTWSQVDVIHTVTVQIPETKRDGRPWDSVVLAAPFRGSDGVKPDILICVSSENVQKQCAAICQDRERVPETCAPTCRDSFTCTGRLEPNGVLAQSWIDVEIIDVDYKENDPVATIRVPEPRLYTREPFEFKPRPQWPFRIQFQITRQTAYFGPFRGGQLTIPRKPPPPSAPQAPAPSTDRLTPSMIETALAAAGLRDANNCTGEDKFFPEGPAFLQGRKHKQWYELATLALSLDDVDLQRRMLAQIKTRIKATDPSDDEYEVIFENRILTQVQGRLERDMLLKRALAEVIQEFAIAVLTKGLDRYAGFPAGGLSRTMIEEWIYGQLATDYLTDRAFDLILGDRSISAECALNELAKRGFMREVALR